MRRSLLDICKNVCGELSFQIPPTVLSSTDLLTQQIRYLTSAACEELLEAHDWNSLLKVASIPLTGVSEYVIPDDVVRIIPGSFSYSSSSTATNSVAGSVSPQTMNTLTVPTGVLGLNQVTFQQIGGKLKIFPTNLTGGTLKFTYLSSKYIINSGGTEYKDTFSQDSDIPLFSSRLVTAAVKLKVLQTKGLDTNAVTQDFNYLLELAKQTDVPAPILDIANGIPDPITPLTYQVL
jgi:hypothetical protein